MTCFIPRTAALVKVFRCRSCSICMFAVRVNSKYITFIILFQKNVFRRACNPIIAEEEKFDEPDLPVRFSPGLECLIDGCTAAGSKFMVRTKFVRHWEEKHEPFASKFECAVKECKSLVRMKEDTTHRVKTRREGPTND